MLAWIGVAAWYLPLSATVLGIGVLVVFCIVRRTQRRGRRNVLRHEELLGRSAPRP